jgi:flavodoxin
MGIGGAMKVLIVCQSVHHGNTLKVAQAMAERLDAEVRKPSEVTARDLGGYDLVGFGSGIYNQKHHLSLLRMAETVEGSEGGKCFVFSTATTRRPEPHESLKKILEAKGLRVVGEFVCPGFMDYSFTKLWFGGINKGRPNGADLNQAREFASRLRTA